jgi:hypothetical protein
VRYEISCKSSCEVFCEVSCVDEFDMWCSEWGVPWREACREVNCVVKRWVI